MHKILFCLLMCLLLFACVSDSSQSAAAEDAKIAEQNKLTTEGSKKDSITPSNFNEAIRPTEALIISRIFDNENFTVTEGIQTQVYGLKWNLSETDAFIQMPNIMLIEPMPFDFSVEMTDPLEPCGDQMQAIFSYSTNSQNTTLNLETEIPFSFYNCAHCLQGLKLQFKENTFTDRDIEDKLLPSLVFVLEAADSLNVPQVTHLRPLHITGDGFVQDISTLTEFFLYGSFTNYGEETKNGQNIMEFEFTPDWQRTEQGKVVFRDVEVNSGGERKVLTEMNWTWEIKGPAKIALFDQNGDRYDVTFTSKIFDEDDTQSSHIQFEWKGKTFTSMAMNPC